MRRAVAAVVCAAARSDAGAAAWSGAAWSVAYDETSCENNPRLADLGTSKSLGECKAACEADAACNFINYAVDSDHRCMLYGTCEHAYCRAGPPAGWWTTYQYLRPGSAPLPKCGTPTPPPPPPPPPPTPPAPPPATLALPHVLASGMLLQHGQDAAIWGTAAPGAGVRIALDGGTPVTGAAGADGAFSLPLAAQPPGTGHSIDVTSGGQAVRLTDVAFGDLYLCSGQSNMEYVAGATFNHSAEVRASADPSLRLYTVSKGARSTPQADAAPEAYGWGAAAPATVQPNGNPDQVFDVPFSSTCYYFGRELRREVGVPVGLIASSVGGSAIEPWMTPAALQRCGSTQQGSGFWNAMVAPLAKLRFAGMVWYQGESNTGDPPRYAACFPAAIEDWRAQLAAPSLPFLFVQLSPSSSGNLDPYGDRDDSYGRPMLDVRHAQLQALRLPAVGMATAADLGDPGCAAGAAGCMGVAGDAGLHAGHPRVKQPVGARLAQQALRVVYGKGVNTDGPLVASAAPAAAGVEVRFTNAAGLHLRNTTMCGLFAGGRGVCCSASSFEVSSDAGRTWTRTGLPQVDAARGVVTLPLPAAGRAAAQLVRYAWVDTPQCMLYNTAPGLPAIPFNVTVAAR